jgi:hypothetical protein
MITLKPSMVTSYFKAFYHAQWRKSWVPGPEHIVLHAAGAVDTGMYISALKIEDVEQTMMQVIPEVS